MSDSLLNNRYQIIQTLGSGGFGTTFLAQDMQMPSHRSCVIKQLKPIINSSQIYQLVQERFGREAAILEELGEENPQIPRLYAYFHENSLFYLVQEWVDGETLTNLVRNSGKLTEDFVKEILLSLLPVLDFIHAKRIIHRDIKPDNIILRKKDQKPFLIDFGAVKETMGTVVNSQGNATSSIVIGTPGFMPSEQAAGRPVYSSDLYSLALSAIYLLTGKWPQDLETDSRTGEIIWQHYAPNITQSLAAILDRAICYHPRERYATAQEMLAALQCPISIPSTVISTPENNITLPISPSFQSNSQSTSSVPLSQSPPVYFLILGGTISAFILVAVVFLYFNSSHTTSISKETEAVISSNPINQISRPSSEQAIRNYYAAINNRQYETGWQTLSPQLRNNSESHPEGYQSYTDWWTKVNFVEVLNTHLADSTSEFSTVEADLQYTMESGRIIDQTLRFYFIWDNSTNRWLIDKVDRL
jgi:serine/threonine-protein kinase